MLEIKVHQTVTTRELTQSIVPTQPTGSHSGHQLTKGGRPLVADPLDANSTTKQIQ